VSSEEPGSSRWKEETMKVKSKVKAGGVKRGMWQ
jgi:hypothetical protein